MTGQLFLIVGNSGSGKDSLIEEALKDYPEDKKPIKIPRRYITRLPHETEPFISVTEEEFLKLKEEDKFILDWHIYDLYYGVPASVLDWLKDDINVLVNVSRSILDEARQKIPGVKVIFVQVPFETTKERILSRGREDENDPVFKERLERAKKKQTLPSADKVIDNSGPLEEGGKELRDYLLSFA